GQRTAAPVPRGPAPLRFEFRFVEVFAVLTFQPVEDQPEVALEDRPLQRGFDQLLPIFLQELLQEGNGPLVRLLFEEVLGSQPQEGLEAIPPVGAAVRTDADEQGLVQPVPQGLRIGVVQRPLRRGPCRELYWPRRR